MNCSDISCGFNSYIYNGSCQCSYYDFGGPENFCISPLEILWYSSNICMFIYGTICCIKFNNRKRRTYKNLSFENDFENDFSKDKF